MARKATTNDNRKRKASQQQDGSQGVGVLSSISLNKKMQAVAKLGQCVQRDLRLLHGREQAAQVADAKSEIDLVKTAIAQSSSVAKQAQADWAQDSANFADEETGQVEIVNTRVNKAVRRCEAERAAAAERITKTCAEANAA